MGLNPAAVALVLLLSDLQALDMGLVAVALLVLLLQLLAVELNLVAELNPEAECLASPELVQSDASSFTFTKLTMSVWDRCRTWSRTRRWIPED